MRMDRLTNQLQAALADAQSLAVGRDHNFIMPAHLLHVLLEQQGGTVRPLLLQCGVGAHAVATAFDWSGTVLKPATWQPEHCAVSRG